MQKCCDKGLPEEKMNLASSIASTVATTAALFSPPQPTQDNKNAFNPQISVVGDFAIQLDRNDGEKRRADFREIEFGFAADADPMLRVELYYSIVKEDDETKIELEEGFGRYQGIGRGISMKFGKLAGAIGRVQRNHVDALNFMDYPLVIQDVLGEEGFRHPGASLSYLFPGNRFMEATVEMFDVQEDGPVFGGTAVDDPAWLGHFRTFHDFSDSLSAQFGATYMRGPDLGGGNAKVTGLDFTMKYQPEGASASWVLESEALWAKPSDYSDKTFGWFGRATLNLPNRWSFTGGYDYSELPGTSDVRKGWLFGATFRATEFHRWRVEYQSLTSNFGNDRRYLTLQFQWVIGAHPAHVY
ncbi:MAG: hypothetical protein EDM74_02095 [Armatimonadetes bacterium]|nr:MAG: hypothetical protein EDM74_02095 [Armatimonadota bacterium]